MPEGSDGISRLEITQLFYVGASPSEFHFWHIVRIQSSGPHQSPRLPKDCDRRKLLRGTFLTHILSHISSTPRECNVHTPLFHSVKLLHGRISQGFDFFSSLV